MSTEDEVAQPGTEAGRGGHWFTIFLAVACLALAVEVMLLVRKTRRLEGEIARLSAAMQPGTVEVGDAFEPLTLIGEDGEEVSLRFGHRQPHTLMLLFTMSCPACEKTFPIWSEIIPAEETPALRVAAIRLDRDPGLVEASTNVLPVPVYTAKERGKTLQKITRIPITVLVDGSGVVEKVWSGYLTPEKQQDLRNALEATTNVIS